jgi:hypothetical protein
MRLPRRFTPRNDLREEFSKVSQHLQEVGKEVARGDIAECMRLGAEHDTDSSAGGQVAKETAAGAVLGHAGRGAATGAAGGGVGGFKPPF